MREETEILEMIDMTEDGRAVAKKDRRVYFVDGGIYGETARCRLSEIKKNGAVIEAVKIESLQAGPYQEKPLCPHFGQCDGCSLQNISEQAQRDLKKRQLTASITRLAEIDWGEIDVLPTKPYAYRNKISLKVRNGEIGYYNRKTHRLVPVTCCPIAGEKINRTLKEIRKILPGQSCGIKELVLREGENGVQIRLIGDKITTEDILRFKRLDPVELSIEDGNKEKLFRKEKLCMSIGQRHFHVSPKAFFQVNTPGVTILYDQISQWVGPKKNIIDLYCGIGAIGQSMTSPESIVGIEILAQAVKDARENALLNGIRAEYITGKAEAVFSQCTKKDILIVDPPRKGLDAALIKRIIQSPIEEMIYVSCHPASLARDMKRLKTGGFFPQKIVGVDMFPQTTHVETVALMSRR